MSQFEEHDNSLMSFSRKLSPRSPIVVTSMTSFDGKRKSETGMDDI